MDVDKIKIVENSWMARIAAKRLKVNTVAFTLGTTIYLHNASRLEFLADEKWVRHELKHVEQFMKYGFLNFLFRYVVETFKKGYFNNKFEIEARMAEEKA